MHWAGKTGAALVDPGAPITGARTISNQGTREDVTDGPFNGWSVIEAADLDAAARLLKDHPFIGRGGALQINEPASI